MGGNALALTTRRMSRGEVNDRQLTLIPQLTSLLQSPVLPVVSYFDKETFGDLDLLVSTQNLRPNWVQDVLDHFQPKQYHHNGGVLSFEYRYLQVDLITVKPESLLFAYQYFAYNDLGNLLGRIAHKMGLKFGSNGLSYVLRKGDYVVGEILVTQSFQEALELMGYDPKRYAKGFYSLVNLFEYVASSKYFNPDIYLLDNRNAKSRVRDAKRKTYMDFLVYCALLPKFEPYMFLPKTDYLPAIEDKFPQFKKSLAELKAKYEAAELIKKEFNGTLVGEWTGLTGKDLGAFMKAFRSSIEADPQYGDSPWQVDTRWRYYVALYGKELIQPHVVEFKKRVWDSLYG